MPQLFVSSKRHATTFSNQDVKWAAQKNIAQVGGGIETVPVGPACEECFEIGTEVLMYETVEDFFVDMDGNKDVGANNFHKTFRLQHSTISCSQKEPKIII